MSNETQRVGRFKVAQELVMDWRKLLPFMGQVVIVRAECLFAQKCIEYTAYSDLFEENPFGCEAPEYFIQFIKRDDGSLTFKASKV